MTNTLTTWALGLALTAALVPAVHGQDAVFWKSVGNWEISIDPTVRNGCYALASWNGGTVLRIGMNPQEDNFYMLIGNNDWTSLSPDTAYDISIRFDNRLPWEVSARGLQFSPGETVYLHAESTKFDFLEEFMGGYNMKISYDGKVIDTLKLTGSRRAMNEVAACQESADQYGSGARDPFAGTPKSGRKADPFAN